MNLQENIQRIREMMGLINENIDDILDKMNQGEELTQQDKDKMMAYSKHMQAGGRESDFEYEEKEEQPQPNTLYKIDEWGRLDLNTPIEQVWKILDDTFKGMKIAEGVEKWRPWNTSLNKVVDKEDQPDEQLIKWRIAFWTSEGGRDVPEIGILENIDTGEKQVWVKKIYLSVNKEKYGDLVSDPFDNKQFYIFFNKNPQGGDSKAVEFGRRAIQSWVEKTFELERNRYEFLFLNKSDRMYRVLNEIKDDVIGEI